MRLGRCVFAQVLPSELLAVLVERSGRELPIEANVVGLHMELGPGEHVKLTGPDPLELEIKSDA